MRRLCGRPGCSAPATATFTFDATRCVVWLNPVSEGSARAGDLCTRHADGLTPPQGWERVDRRTPLAVEVSAAPLVLGGATAPTAPAASSASRVAVATATATAARIDGDGERDDLLPARRRRRKRWSEVPSLFEGEGD